jgi:hypothetical protein
MMQETRTTFESWVKSYSTLPTDRDEHGYADMTVEMLQHAWQAGLAHGRAESAEAAAETVRATVVVAGETPEELRKAIAARVADVAKPTHWLDGLCGLQWAIHAIGTGSRRLEHLTKD